MNGKCVYSKGMLIILELEGVEWTASCFSADFPESSLAVDQNAIQECIRSTSVGLPLAR